MIHFVFEISNGCCYYLYWMGQEPLEIHTQSSSHNLDGEEKKRKKNTHISSQQLFSWVINRVRCAQTGKYTQWEWDDDSDQLKTKIEGEWSNKQECEYHFQVSYSSNWMPIHDLFDQSYIFSAFSINASSLHLIWKHRKWKKTKDKGTESCTAQNDELTLFLALFPLGIFFVLFYFALFLATKKRVFIHLFGLSSYSSTVKRKMKKQVSFNWK